MNDEPRRRTGHREDQRRAARPARWRTLAIADVLKNGHPCIAIVAEHCTDQGEWVERRRFVLAMSDGLTVIGDIAGVLAEETQRRLANARERREAQPHTLHTPTNGDPQ